MPKPPKEPATAWLVAGSTASPEKKSVVTPGNVATWPVLRSAMTMVPGAEVLAASVTATTACRVAGFCPKPPTAGNLSDCSAGLMLTCGPKLPAAKFADDTTSLGPLLTLSSAVSSLDWLSAAHRICPNPLGGFQVPPAVPVATGLSTRKLPACVAGLKSSYTPRSRWNRPAQPPEIGL